MIKRVIIFLLLLILFINPSALKAEEGQLELTAEAAVLMDRDSRRVLYAQNPHQKRPMASTTKIMTAVTALEAGDLDDVVIVSERAAAIGGSSIWLSAGEEKTLEELLYGLMLRSGNDAAVAIAEHIAGSIEAFAVMMTKKAREIGALNSSFKNPHGLHDEKHYITAYDLSLIASYALRNPKFREIIATRDIAISWPGAEWDRLLHNQNRLLDLYPGGDGVKTGWTTPAGRCFVGSATRDGWQLVATVLNAPDMYNDAIMLLDYGFNNFTNKRLIAQGQFLRRVEVEKGVQGSVRVLAEREIVFPLRDAELKDIHYNFKMEEIYSAPLAKGDYLGELELFIGNERIGSTPLIAGEEVKKAPFYMNFIRFWRSLFNRR